MISSGPVFARLSAALVSVCLLWTFAACLSICSEHVEEAREVGAVAAAAEEVCASRCAEPCPVTGTAAPLPVKRFALDTPEEGGHLELVPGGHESPDATPLPKPPSNTLRPPGSPFERLRTLRI